MIVHQLEIRSLKEQNIQLLEERHYKATAAYMENAIHMSAPQPPANEANDPKTNLASVV